MEENEELDKTDSQKKQERFRKFLSLEDPVFTVKSLVYIYLLY